MAARRAPPPPVWPIKAGTCAGSPSLARLLREFEAGGGEPGRVLARLVHAAFDEAAALQAGDQAGDLPAGEAVRPSLSLIVL